MDSSLGSLPVAANTGFRKMKIFFRANRELLDIASERKLGPHKEILTLREANRMLGDARISFDEVEEHIKEDNLTLEDAMPGQGCLAGCDEPDLESESAHETRDATPQIVPSQVLPVDQEEACPPSIVAETCKPDENLKEELKAYEDQLRNLRLHSMDSSDSLPIVHDRGFRKMNIFSPRATRLLDDARVTSERKLEPEQEILILAELNRMLDDAWMTSNHAEEPWIEEENLTNFQDAMPGRGCLAGCDEPVYLKSECHETDVAPQIVGPSQILPVQDEACPPSIEAEKCKPDENVEEKLTACDDQLRSILAKTLEDSESNILSVKTSQSPFRKRKGAPVDHHLLEGAELEGKKAKQSFGQDFLEGHLKQSQGEHIALSEEQGPLEEFLGKYKHWGAHVFFEDQQFEDTGTIFHFLKQSGRAQKVIRVETRGFDGVFPVAY